jgi:cobalt-zinc-cadmium efflux system membrane fusion protein
MMRAISGIVLSLALASCSAPKPDAPAVEQTGGLIRMTEAAQRRAGVVMEPARVLELNDSLSVTGSVQPADGRVAEVRALAQGRLLSVAARVGDRVAAGQELARVDNLEAGEWSAQLAAARSEARRIEVLLAAQRGVVERGSKLVEIGATSRREYDQSRAEAGALEASLRSQQEVVVGLTERLRRFGPLGAAADGAMVSALRAPFAGIVIKAAAAPGEVVNGERGLFTVADLSRVWVQAAVYEQDLGRVKVGETARIRVDAYPDESFTGTVRYISDTLDPQTRTAPVRCDVANPRARLKLDMYVTVELPTTLQRRALAVAESAVQQVEGKRVVFIRRAADRFEMREVRAGKTTRGRVEILAGLKEGEPVVTAGAFHLKSIRESGELGEE